MSWKPNIILAGAVILAAASMAGSALAADSDQNLAAGEEQSKQLLLLMDKDKNGKVSKQEFMSFMEEEFARLDKNHDGELDVGELNEAQIRGFNGKRPGGR
jgi:Ca2+-binding EF-hand superfamily protein